MSYDHSTNRRPAVKRTAVTGPLTAFGSRANEKETVDGTRTCSGTGPRLDSSSYHDFDFDNGNLVFKRVADVERAELPKTPYHLRFSSSFPAGCMAYHVCLRVLMHII